MELLRQAYTEINGAVNSYNEPVIVIPTGIGYALARNEKHG